jgi:hypothetical protein
MILDQNKGKKMIYASSEEFKNYCEGKNISSISTVCGETEIKFTCGSVALVTNEYDDRYGWETEYKILPMKAS